jgi:hypothetical protein
LLAVVDFFFVVEGFFAAEDFLAIAVDLCFAFEDFFEVDGLAGASLGFALAATTASCATGAVASGGAGAATGSGSAADPDGVGGSGAIVLGGGAGACATGTTFASGVAAREACEEVASLIATTAPITPMAAIAPHWRRSRARRNAGCIVGTTGTSLWTVGGGVSPISAMTNRLLSFDPLARGTAVGCSSGITKLRGERSGWTSLRSCSRGVVTPLPPSTEKGRLSTSGVAGTSDRGAGGST